MAPTVGSDGSELPHVHFQDRDGGGIQNSDVGVTVAVGKIGCPRGGAMENQIVEGTLEPVKNDVLLGLSTHCVRFHTN
jgi:hypothetical protein